MGKAETLQKIKEAEAELRHARDVALANKERLIREARAEALAIRAEYEKRAEARRTEILRQEEIDVASERKKALEEGRQLAESLRADARDHLEAGTERLLERFRSAVRA